MNVVQTGLSGLVVVEPDVYGDNRGFFLETWAAHRYETVGISCDFVQDNHSRSAAKTLRGLHYQSSPGQAKLIRVVRGQIYDVAVDIRPDSPTFGQHFGILLDDQDHRQLFVPVGFAHGFCVVSDGADVVYKVSTPYNAATECGLAFDDPELAVPWPVTTPLLSERDKGNESFAAYRTRMQL